MSTSPGHPSDADRPPLDAATLRTALVRPGGAWSRLRVVEVTGSTNADLAAAARAGEAAPGEVLVAEEQTSGRGRLGRGWSAPPRSGLFFSVLLDPEPAVPADRLPWLPLLAGVAVSGALSGTTGVATALKWPNDLLVAVGDEERKLGGILAERVPGGGVVLGVGLNVSLRADELPVPTAGSLALAGARVGEREPLLCAVLEALGAWYTGWAAAGGDPATGGDPAVGAVRDAYVARCATLGRAVRAELPGGGELRGTAVALDDEGRLVIGDADGARHPVGAGDIVHLRAT
ncbi:BirA family transcriptional regulator, biotin operon repressor / biotin-[acetyl-CoA-carboxylase] ligase [Streptomyces zhaozhouensis]|uniref:biotin--[biotin carboxyl-carrier protein] ligase n=1 Tax=Streptomyces zhaozhouensis TaxID=1300267 RepID=A0A286DTT3_9ACTN|nr:biotin--[acetyl-CoA-carboxylase] ligase [Streptomyces zhaozhouensis]SOD62065.1 BirA family transcriptional regulator, biotin operon repressor / biotin-[acetyl-CoA-carboxylase] ligase [Streptomyces zhaozhouensis]